MTNLQHVLDEMGTPPNDLLLDWAWQLYDCSVELDVDTDDSEAKSKAGSSSDVAGRLIVSTQGELELQEKLSAIRIRYLAFQFAEGMKAGSKLELGRGVKEEEPNELSSNELRQRLEQLTSAYSTSSQLFPSRRRATSKPACPNAVKLLFVVIAFASCLLVAFIATYPGDEVPSHDIARTDSKTSLGQYSPRSENGAVAQTEVELLGDIPQHPTEIELEPDQKEELLASKLGLDNLFSPGQVEVEKNANKSQAAVNSASVPDGEQPVEVAKVGVEEQLKPYAREAMEDAAKVDVLAELKEVAKEAESDVREMELAKDLTDRAKASAAEAAATAKQLEPFILPTVPMMQVQKLSPQYKERAREPNWKLRVATTEGFKVMPPGPQTLAKREPARWTIRTDEESSAETVVYLQAELVGSRGRSIRWRIGVGSKDLPQLVLPLGQQYLDRLQLNLAAFQTRLQFAVDQLKAAGRMTGFPSDIRSAMTAQRRGFEIQLELATKILAVASEANQFEGWLDGQLEIHAEFIDAAAQGSPPLLQFGSLEAPKSTDQQDEAKDAKQ